jgi:ribosomal protein S12 methylthiotransferase accessory factor
VARLTDLDRCGVEVATAVRPAGHVLQVTQGKGLDFDRAVMSALGEAAELAAAETVNDDALVFGEGRAWVEASRLGAGGGEGELVPADAVWCAPFGSTWLGPVTSDWSTNGLAAQTTRAAAIEHAVLELIERDALARVLPTGWSMPRVANRRVALESSLSQHIEARGFEVYAFDLSPNTRVSVAGVLLFDAEAGLVPLTAGYAARRTSAAALEAALLEAAQSRLTEIHGAREDVSIGVRTQGAELRAALKAQRVFASRKLPPPSTAEVHALTDADLFVVELSTQPLHVVKVLSPQLLASELV